MTEATFQPMPDLAPEQYDALKAEIETKGIVVPIVVDQHGRVLDGHNRKAIADELGIDCPTETRFVADDAEAEDLAVILNCARRHLNREQIRQIVANEIVRKPDDSDRAIARRVGCSPSTVGSVRKPLSNLDSGREFTDEDIARARRSVEEIQDLLGGVRDVVLQLACVALSNKIMPAEIVMVLTAAQREHAGRREREVSDVFRDTVFNPVIDYVMRPATFEYWRPQWDHETFKPLTDEERADLLDGIASLGGAEAARGGHRE